MNNVAKFLSGLALAVTVVCAPVDARGDNFQLCYLSDAAKAAFLAHKDGVSYTNFINRPQYSWLVHSSRESWSSHDFEWLMDFIATVGLIYVHDMEDITGKTEAFGLVVNFYTSCTGEAPNPDNPDKFKEWLLGEM